DVRKVVDRVRMEAPDVYLRLHFHDTRGAGLANVAAAVEAGIDVIDASCGGIGGCPFAPAATGNVATEDVVYMLERAGYKTGLDLGKLIETAHWLETVLGHPVSSSLSKAGGFP
ncbi:MAG: hydroxymethylglutaryl-CoA lyase, partial [Pseudomonadota bacterium]